MANNVTKLECEQKNAVEMAKCTTNKAAANNRCEADKAWLVRVADFGAVGNVSGALAISGNVSACVRQIALDSSLESADIDIYLGLGQGATDVSLADLKLIPKEQGKFLTCMPRWQNSVSTKASIVQQITSLRGKTKGVGQSAGYALAIETGQVNIRALLDPPPFIALFAAHPDLEVDCSTLDTATNGPTVRALRHEDLDAFGKYMLHLPELHFTLPIQPIQIPLATGSIEGSPIFSSESIVFYLRRTRSATGR